MNAGTVDTLVRHRLATVIAELDAITAGLHGGDSLATQVAALRTRLDGVDRQLGSISELGLRFDAFDRRLLGLGGRVDTVITRLRAQEALSARGLVVVETAVGRAFDVYAMAVSQVGAAGRARAPSGHAALMGRGNSLGVFWLAPGDYTVRADPLPARSFSVSAGAALAISMRPFADRDVPVRTP